MIHMLLAALAAMPSCWGIYDAALTHSAAAPHPPYITYDERVSVNQDGEALLRSAAHIDYRDDGIARVADERFAYDPFVTRNVEPGPPELGPYGSGRSMWLPQAPGVPTIAALRATGKVSCSIAGVGPYRSRQAYHLIFRGAIPARPHLDDLWVDVQSHDIWRVDVTGPVDLLAGADSSIGLGKYEIELTYSGPYLVVDHVTWRYRQRVYSQEADYTAEYSFSGFAFPRELPSSYFASISQPLEQSQ